MKELTAIQARKLLGKDTTMHVQINDGPSSEPSITIFRWDDIAVMIKWDRQEQCFRYFQDTVVHPNPDGNPYNDGKVGFLG